MKRDKRVNMKYVLILSVDSLNNGFTVYNLQAWLEDGDNFNRWQWYLLIHLLDERSRISAWETSHSVDKDFEIFEETFTEVRRDLLNLKHILHKLKITLIFQRRRTFVNIVSVPFVETVMLLKAKPRNCRFIHRGKILTGGKYQTIITIFLRITLILSTMLCTWQSVQQFVAF